MSSTPKVLLQAIFAPNGAATGQYTSPINGKGTWIDVALAVNDNAAAQTLSLNHVPAAGGVAAVNQLTKAKSIAAGASDLLPEVRGRFLNPGDSIAFGASAAASISVSLIGRELT